MSEALTQAIQDYGGDYGGPEPHEETRRRPRSQRQRAKRKRTAKLGIRFEVVACGGVFVDIRRAPLVITRQ